MSVADLETRFAEGVEYRAMLTDLPPFDAV